MPSDDDPPTEPWPVLPRFFSWGDEEPAPSLPRPVEPASPVSQQLVDVVRRPAPASRPLPWRQMALAAGAAAIVTVISLVAWAFLGGESPTDPVQASTTPSSAAVPTTVSTPHSQSPEFDTRLMALLPRGYPPGTCRPAPPPACRGRSRRG